MKLKAFVIKGVVAALAAGCVLVCLIVACTTLTKLKKDPKAEFEGLAIAEPTAEGAVLLFLVRVENPNEVPIEVDALDYALDVEGKPFAKGAIDEKTSVPANGKITLKVPVSVKYQDLFSSVLDFLQGKSRKYVLRGGARFGWIRVPFEKAGEVKFQGGG